MRLPVGTAARPTPNYKSCGLARLDKDLPLFSSLERPKPRSAIEDFGSAEAEPFQSSSQPYSSRSLHGLVELGMYRQMSSFNRS
jgi:hypothetical protein